VLTDDTSIDGDIMGEKIRPKDFVDDADVERVMAVIEQCSLRVERRAAKRDRKKERAS
jgi:hypothetical protein